jgi:flavin reductase (DIM6/NTAB) family NADH-FMN oxidoreductase RutF
MRRYPTGVAVVTIDLDGERLGLTVGSLVSLSLEPPLVGFAVSREAALHELLRRAGTFVVSLLGADQEAVAQHFARGVPPIALWEGISVRDESESPPFLAGAVGWLRCRLWHECEAGDHTFFIGEVLQVESGGGRPLVYYGQSYAPL